MIGDHNKNHFYSSFCRLELNRRSYELPFAKSIFCSVVVLEKQDKVTKSFFPDKDCESRYYEFLLASLELFEFENKKLEVVCSKLFEKQHEIQKVIIVL